MEEVPQAPVEHLDPMDSQDLVENLELQEHLANVVNREQEERPVHLVLKDNVENEAKEVLQDKLGHKDPREDGVSVVDQVQLGLVVSLEQLVSKVAKVNEVSLVVMAKLERQDHRYVQMNLHIVQFSPSLDGWVGGCVGWVGGCVGRWVGGGHGPLKGHMLTSR